MTAFDRFRDAMSPMNAALVPRALSTASSSYWPWVATTISEFSPTPAASRSRLGTTRCRWPGFRVAPKRGPDATPRWPRQMERLVGTDPGATAKGLQPYVHRRLLDRLPGGVVPPRAFNSSFQRNYGTSSGIPLLTSLQ